MKMAAFWVVPIFRAHLTYRPDDGGSTDLRNVGKVIPVYTALQPRRQPSSYITTLLVQKVLLH
jgi:hypothetical protein